jgi:hypothetical protein
MIERFSEDIDLVVLRREGETDSKLKSKLKAVSTVVETVLPEVPVKGITHKMGMNRKTAHSYSKEFNGDYGHVRDVIILETLKMIRERLQAISWTIKVEPKK